MSGKQTSKNLEILPLPYIDIILGMGQFKKVRNYAIKKWGIQLLDLYFYYYY